MDGTTASAGAQAEGSSPTPPAENPHLNPANLAIGRVFRHHLTVANLDRCVAQGRRPDNSRVNSLSFSWDGRFLACSTGDGELQCFNVVRGEPVGAGISTAGEGGCRCVTHTPHPAVILYANDTPMDSTVTIRALDYCHAQIVSEFSFSTRGKSDVLCTEISKSLTDDCFQTSSTDGYIRLWDLRSNHCLGEILVGSGKEGNASAYDPTGLTFAISKGASEVLLYDSRKYTQGPFGKMPLPRNFAGGVKYLRYRPQGDLLAVGGIDGGLCSLWVKDSSVVMRKPICYERTTAHQEARVEAETSSGEMCWTPDGRYLTAGNEDGTVSQWDALKGTYSDVMGGNVTGQSINRHPAPVGCLKWNPRAMMAASACHIVVLWVGASS